MTYRPHPTDVVECMLGSDSLFETLKEYAEGQLTAHQLSAQLDAIRVSAEEFLVAAQKEGA